MQPLDAGEKILYMYLERYPLNQQKFAAFKNTPLMMLKGKVTFNNNVIRFLGVRISSKFCKLLRFCRKITKIKRGLEKLCDHVVCDIVCVSDVTSRPCEFY